MTLTRDRVVLAAIRVVQREGFSGMSMRRVAQHLDVQAMSLYIYVESKDDLILGMVEELCGKERAAELRFAPDDDPLTRDLTRAQRLVEIGTRLTSMAVNR